MCMGGDLEAIVYSVAYDPGDVAAAEEDVHLGFVGKWDFVVDEVVADLFVLLHA